MEIQNHVRKRLSYPNSNLKNSQSPQISPQSSVTYSQTVYIWHKPPVHPQTSTINWCTLSLCSVIDTWVYSGCTTKFQRLAGLSILCKTNPYRTLFSSFDPVLDSVKPVFKPFIVKICSLLVGLDRAMWVRTRVLVISSS